MVTNETFIDATEQVFNAVGALPPEVLARIEPLITIFKAAGILFIVYIVFLIVQLIFKFKEIKKIKKMSEDIEKINKKVDYLVKSSNKKNKNRKKEK